MKLVDFLNANIDATFFGYVDILFFDILKLNTNTTYKNCS